MFKKGDTYNFLFKFPDGDQTCYENAKVVEYDETSGLIKIIVNDFSEAVLNLRHPTFYGAF